MKENIIVEKTFRFSLDIISLYKDLQEQREFVLSKQLLRSGTGIGANVSEATAGQSKKDFIAKMIQEILDSVVREILDFSSRLESIWTRNGNDLSLRS